MKAMVHLRMMGVFALLATAVACGGDDDDGKGNGDGDGSDTADTDPGNDTDTVDTGGPQGIDCKYEIFTPELDEVVLTGFTAQDVLDWAQGPFNVRPLWHDDSEEPGVLTSQFTGDVSVKQAGVPDKQCESGMTLGADFTFVSELGTLNEAWSSALVTEDGLVARIRGEIDLVDLGGTFNPNDVTDPGWTEDGDNASYLNINANLNSDGRWEGRNYMETEAHYDDGSKEGDWDTDEVLKW